MSHVKPPPIEQDTQSRILRGAVFGSMAGVVCAVVWSVGYYAYVSLLYAKDGETYLGDYSPLIAISVVASWAIGAAVPFAVIGATVGAFWMHVNKPR